MKKEPILSIEGLSKTYETVGGAVCALDNISFQLEEGELLAVMGTSGSGKSTLLNLIGAADTPTAGEINLMVFMMKGCLKNHNRLYIGEKISDSFFNRLIC